MSDPIARKSPLYRVTGTTVRGLSERSLEGHLILRGNADDAAFTAAVGEATGVPLPVQANSVSSTDGCRIAWLGPSEWMLTVAAGSEHALRSRLEQALTGQHVSVVDVSDGYTTVVLEDPEAADILARDCPLDFHASRFPVGACAQSALGKANALILREADNRFALVIRRSFAEYQWALLAHATHVAQLTR